MANRVPQFRKPSSNRSAATVVGRRPVGELLQNREQEIDRLLVAKHLLSDYGTTKKVRPIHRLLDNAKQRKIPIESATKDQLDQLSNLPHQGVIAFVQTMQYMPIETMLAQSNPVPLFVMLDSVQDPHNLGAIIRTAEAANADGVIIPERRAAQLTEGTFKSSAGGVTHLPVSRVKNLVQTIGWLQTQKIWVVGADVSGTKVYTQADLRQPTCLVLGGEENGLRHLTKERCDFCVSIPMLGKIASLNVSVAAGILLYEVIRQRANDK